MRSIAILLAGALCAFADLTYLSTEKNAAGAGKVTKHLVKGNKTRAESASSVIITDFDAQTIMTLSPTTKTYRVTKMFQPGDALDKVAADFKADVKETGATKAIGGYKCKQVVMTMSMTGPMASSMEMEMWTSADVPGAAELKAMGVRMAERSAGASGNPQLRKAFADIQRRMAKLDGVPVLTIMRAKAGDDEQSKKLQSQMQAARAQLEAMKKQGGPQAAAIEKAMASMPAAGGKYLMETTTEFSGFSTAAIPASEFAVPAGYTKAGM